MANIDLKEFVNINIVRHETSSAYNIRDTILLYTPEVHTPNMVNEQDTYTGLITSESEASLYFADNSVTLAYLQKYFDNGGIKVLVVENTNIKNLTASMLHELDNKYICVAYAYSNADMSATYDSIKNIVEDLNELTSGLDEKLFLCRNTNIDEAKVKNLVVKYSTEIGAEMTIGAYLSQMDVYGNDTVYDYAFTEENIAASDLDNTTFRALMSNNYNVDIELANSIRNCGGNCKNGDDLVNTYVLIILHQTLTNALINLLGQKLKNSQGIAQIYSSISQELEKYLASGYLATDKIWSYDDYVVNVNGVNYTIIEKGTPLVKGYSIKVLPFTSLSEAQKEQRLAPEVYVILADQYGIRKITITGEVF